MALAPEVQAHLDAGDATGLGDPDFAVRRAALNVEIDRMFTLFGLPGPDVRTEEHTILSSGRRLPARTYHPPSVDAAAPAHVLLHGGGWTTGTIDNLVSDATARHRAAETGHVVLAVDYSLAPEEPFPAAVHDVIAAVHWLREHAVGLGVDPARISLGGASAGANLAVAAALAAPELAVTALLLEVPVLDVTQTAPLTEVTEGPEAGVSAELAEEVMAGVMSAYLPDPALRASPLVSPAVADDLSGLPPTYILNAEHDLTRRGAEDFARRLAEAGVPVTTRCYAGALHGSAILTRVWDTARQWHDDSLQILRDLALLTPAH
ncbi:MAG: alpha/beta hydrolase fold domain-containing protein [Actinobacteria bacterium]|uniref:Unannotated protein n=1 Tax=freshwater metagenome TaxID=449393 RepID=A0A6J6REN4_9ZZZZ|nr:alpha/beta hydrolase fold domain-containing protein [Actinomycetota bacterium]